jgi:hypothetical protein
MRAQVIQILLFVLFYSIPTAFGQLTINEGSNKNYSTIVDEDGDFPDWIELYNSGIDTVQLYNYALTDDPAIPNKWTLPNINMLPGEYKVVFCSDKNRKPISGFVNVLNEINYNPSIGWNNHNLSTPFIWDGVSSIVLNSCSYSSTGYTTNSVFNQSNTPYFSTVFNFQDGSPNICQAGYGTKSTLRPNIKFNTIVIGNATQQNSPYDYPAPYGNWYWAAKNQMIFPASELAAAGLSAGPINSIAFDVASTDPNTFYDYIDFSMKLVSHSEVTTAFEIVDTNLRLHTNFKIDSNGETVYLFSPSQQLVSSLFVNCAQVDNSTGSFPDASANIVLFSTGTPANTNNLSQPFNSYLLPPTISVPSGIYNASITVNLSNPNGPGSLIRYTLNGDDPDSNSTLYNGNPIQVFYSGVLKAKAFSLNELPSTTAVSSYLFGINHVTPILSVVTDQENLYGPNGIFTNWQFDWEKAAYVEYFDTAQQLIFSQHAGMQVDGGLGGSRSHPQHSFRVELDDPVLGEGPINHLVIPNRPFRTKYSKLYLRNGSNYYLTLPYKDAAHLEGMAAETNNYYSAWRPISVYINGAYFGLYELREKFDTEYFEEIENADGDSLDLLSLSAWQGYLLRAVEGSVDSFYTSYDAFNNLNPLDTGYWNDADHYFDMKCYNDYIIAETWAGNVDWPGNNIKIYRSNMSDFRWRFCLIDLEGSLGPFGFSTAYDDHIAYVLGADPNNPFINVFLQSIQNPKFKNYFINRYADLMNTSYKYDRLSAVANSFFNQTVIEMPKEYARWGDPNNINGQMSAFIDNHQTFLSELSVRTEQVRNHIQNNFSLTSQVDVTLDVYPAGSGKIKISTIIPTTLPWTGVYFNGNPVEITAIPNIGYEFAYWDTNAIFNMIDTNISVVLNISTSTLFKAVFTPSSIFGNIAISELNYNSDSTRNSSNWIEFHNYGNSPLNISGWHFTDSTLFNDYIFPLNTNIPAGGYLVLVEDTALFHTQFSQLSVYGPLGFGFSNSNEVLTLSDNNNLPVLSMHYYDSIPWPEAPDGYGRTLELINDTLDPNLSSSWFAGCIGGSPGGPYSTCNEAIIFSEINYKSSLTANAGDWVELHNISSNTIDISNWKFRDDDDTHNFNIPLNTVLAPSGRLVILFDSLLFTNRFPSVTNFVGQFNFGLSSNGDAVRLFDATGRLYQSVIYENLFPWPQGANGNGFTLELVNANGNLCDGSNWQNGCPEGSPGSEFIFPCSVASTSNTILNDLSFFPNPTNGLINIQFPNLNRAEKEINIEVFNYIGDNIYSEQLKSTRNNFSIDLQGHAKGIYLTRININGETIDRLIILN